MPRLSRRRALLAGAFACLALLGWQGVTTIGRNGPVDAGEHLRYAEYLDAHGSLPGKAQNYEYATPPLFHAIATAAEHAVRRLPSHRAELPSNVLTRALWLLLAAAGIACLTSARRGLRRRGPPRSRSSPSGASTRRSRSGRRSRGRRGGSSPLPRAWPSCC